MLGIFVTHGTVEGQKGQRKTTHNIIDEREKMDGGKMFLELQVNGYRGDP